MLFVRTVYRNPEKLVLNYFSLKSTIAAVDQILLLSKSLYMATQISNNLVKAFPYYFDSCNSIYLMA